MYALVLVLAQATSGSSGMTSGFGASRPVECGPSEGSKTANIWERAKEPQLRQYCELLARGTAHLVNSPNLVKEVTSIADQADKMLPGRAAPEVLKGRALLRMGKSTEALAALTEAKKRDDRALDDPVALLAWARANARTGHLDEAATAYRAALPRTSALSGSERGAAAFEAGMSVMGQGSKGIDDAVAMLRQARRDAQDQLQLAAVVGFALALDRAGQKDESKAVLAERVRSDPKPSLSDPKVAEALADAGVPGEHDALLAIAQETTDAAAARESWKRYSDGAGGKGPWAEQAKQHLGPQKAEPKKVVR